MLFCILCQVRARQEKAGASSIDMLGVRTDASWAHAPCFEDEALMNTATHGADALTALEELVWLYDQTYPFHFVMAATFVDVGTAARWREVLDVLQRRQPLLRVRIERDTSAYPKFVTDEAGRIPLRMSDADVGWAGETSRELQIPFDHRNAPLIRVAVCGDTTDRPPLQDGVDSRAREPLTRLVIQSAGAPRQYAPHTVLHEEFHMTTKRKTAIVTGASQESVPQWPTCSSSAGTT